ncbi:MAG TPA: heme biosynthesis HemY N-terminal domain-containing protein [Burkholderiales bacterium]|jgi:HemY protein|nr:heme biosynthesis HemY N-terminal domain-containing protein [Burkholderiales bacterium]
MRLLFGLLALFAAALALVIAGRVQNGYVLLVYPPYRVELSLLFFAALLGGGFALVYGGLRLVSHAIAMPAYVRAYRARRRAEQAHASLAASLQAYYEGRYARAEKEAQLAYETGPTPGLAALLAARAAHEMRDFERRDRWLERAESAGEALHTARLVTRAELALDERDFGGARDALRTLHGSGPRHIATLRMLLRAERGAGAWHEVLRLSNHLAKRDAIAPAMAHEYKVQALVHLLQEAAGDRVALGRRWHALSSREQAEARVALAAARQANELGDVALAREAIEKALASEWTPALAALYAELPAGMAPAARSAEALVRIERAERWLLERERDAQLLATLGRLCVQAELWGKARSFLEASLSFEETRAAHLELAHLAERLGHASDAQAHYRRAAEIA